MRVGFVLRSAEIKPLFFDLFSYQIIMKVYEMCVSTHVCKLFGIEHLRRAIVSCSTSPPQIQPTNRFVTAKARTSAYGTVLRCSSSGGACALPPLFDGWREGRGGKRSWVARPTNHLVLGSSTHHTRAIQGYYSGSIPGLLTSSAILGRQHRIPSDLRS